MLAMKYIVCIWALVLAGTNCWCAKKLTVDQVEDLLRSMHQEKRSDTEIATALKQVELSQELTRGRMNGLIRFAPGPLSTEQVYVLEAESATLVPPESDLPSTSAPDDVAQKAMLDKAAAYVDNAYEQLPGLTATRISLRFQDNVEALAAASGLQGGAKDVVVGSGFSNPASFVHFIKSSETQIVSVGGSEKPPEQKDTTPWGANKMIALMEPIPALTEVFHDAQSAGELHWLRWESIGGIPAAVFAFDVPRKKTHLDVHICCFPNINQAGIATFYTALTAPALSDGGASNSGGVAGNFQTRTEWHDYNTTAPYHGELFIDPQTGVVVRMILAAELKPSDVVHTFGARVDFGPIRVTNRVYVVPVKSYVDTLVVPNGDSGAATYTTRRTLFTSEYKDYELSPPK